MAARVMSDAEIVNGLSTILEIDVSPPPAMAEKASDFQVVLWTFLVRVAKFDRCLLPLTSMKELQCWCLKAVSLPV
jgi:hypothetical protein